MRSSPLILALLAVFGCVFAQKSEYNSLDSPVLNNFFPVNPEAAEDSLLEFLECTRLCLADGLEAAQIPPHEPFIFNHNVTIPINISVIVLVL